MHSVPSSHQHNVQSLYASHHGWLHGWLRKKLGCTHQAADIAQDTFVRVLKSQQIMQISEPRAFLTSIAHGLVVNHWRHLEIERAYLNALANMGHGETPSPEQQVLVVEALLEIDAMLARLPVKVKQAFLMAQTEGLTYAAIAKELGVSERMVKKYMAQAMLSCLSLKFSS